MLNRKKFFDYARHDIFGGRMSADQVAGLDFIIDEWDKGGYTDPRWLAYIMATPHHETGKKFTAATENLNYSVEGLMGVFSRARISEADCRRLGRTKTRAANQEGIANVIYGGEWGKKNLGNTQTGDGWRYRGRGLVQITGRANYAKYNLAETPELAKEVKTASFVLVDGMVNGKFTGVRLSDFFDHDSNDPVGARQIINRLDKAEIIEDYYQEYLKAVKAAA